MQALAGPCTLAYTPAPSCGCRLPAFRCAAPVRQRQSHLLCRAQLPSQLRAVSSLDKLRHLWSCLQLGALRHLHGTDLRQGVSLRTLLLAPGVFVASGLAFRAPTGRSAVLSGLARAIRINGPLSVFVVLLSVLGATLAGVRQKIVNTVRACQCCHGYGIQRCTLCNGNGIIGWEGKWAHTEPCPLCLGKRFTECSTCGGRYHRPMFHHCRRQPTTNELPQNPRPVMQG